MRDDAFDRSPTTTRWTARRIAKWTALGVGGLGVFTGLVVLLYASSMHVAAGRSDKATTILVGQSIAQGHLLLSDWALPPGNYWTTDSAFYAIAIRLFGVREGLLYAEPAVVAALTVVLGSSLARIGRRGAAAVAGVVAVAALLLFAPPAMGLWFVGNGFHVATALYALAAFALLKSRQFDRRWILATALMAFGMVGDKEMVFFAIAPLVGAGLLTMARERRWRNGLVLATAGIAAGVLGELTLKVVGAIGAFTPGPSLPYADPAQVVRNFGNLFTYMADLFGISNGRFGTAGVPHALLDVHIVGGLCIVASVLFALVNGARGAVIGSDRSTPAVEMPWRLDDLLVVAILTSALPFVLLAGPNGVGIHFLSIPVIFSTVLAGRIVARVWPTLSRAGLSRGAAIVGLAASGTFAAGLGYELNLPTPVEPASALASFLESHNLHEGLAPYWTAAITTVVSGDTVHVRPVGIGLNGHVRRMSTQSAKSWYVGHTFDFYVSDKSSSDPVYASAEWTWGTPSHVYVVGRYHVLTWGHPLTLQSGSA
jgi:hypothetical protein